ncbi:MAG: hypothetical protein K6G11_10055 [Lachnospiraceae bacterium]|nr:hypothetical protein [Lachnospiraceae bacterium]
MSIYYLSGGSIHKSSLKPGTEKIYSIDMSSAGCNITFIVNVAPEYLSNITLSLTDPDNKIINNTGYVYDSIHMLLKSTYKISSTGSYKLTISNNGEAPVYYKVRYNIAESKIKSNSDSGKNKNNNSGSDRDSGSGSKNTESNKDTSSGNTGSGRDSGSGSKNTESNKDTGSGNTGSDRDSGSGSKNTESNKDTGSGKDTNQSQKYNTKVTPSPSKAPATGKKPVSSKSSNEKPTATPAPVSSKKPVGSKSSNERPTATPAPVSSKKPVGSKSPNDNKRSDSTPAASRKPSGAKSSSSKNKTSDTTFTTNKKPESTDSLKRNDTSDKNTSGDKSGKKPGKSFSIKNSTASAVLKIFDDNSESSALHDRPEYESSTSNQLIRFGNSFVMLKVGETVELPLENSTVSKSSSPEVSLNNLRFVILDEEIASLYDDETASTLSSIENISNNDDYTADVTPTVTGNIDGITDITPTVTGNIDGITTIIMYSGDKPISSCTLRVT